MILHGFSIQSSVKKLLAVFYATAATTRLQNVFLHEDRTDRNGGTNFPVGLDNVVAPKLLGTTTKQQRFRA